MQIYYASMTGNVKRFIAKLGVEATDIDTNPVANAPYILVCYTFGMGQVPAEVSEWLQRNYKYLRGVAVSGNQNWGDFYGRAGDIISKQYGVPLLHKFELSGNAEDVRIVCERMRRLCDTTN